ncbi:MAG: HAD-IIA family hydrolase [Polyangiaceae bacterium]|nr:HAD-IIA family hydrolase [Polyangiaceae bacterium]
MTISFEELSDSYECIFFDAFGVLKSSAGIYDGVLDCLEALKGRGKDIYVVTNDASKSPDAMMATYTPAGAAPIFEVDEIITSGLLATEYLKNKVRSGHVAYLGKEASAHYIERAGLEAVPVGLELESLQPKALVLLDDEGFDWFEQINQAMNLVRSHNMPVIVANTDITYPSKAQEVGIAIGGLASLLEVALGRQFTRFGKPDPMIFNYAFERARARRPSLEKKDVLMVGDTLSTDIHGGNKYGLDTALVLSGNTLASQYDSLMKAQGIVPNYVCESILT